MDQYYIAVTIDSQEKSCRICYSLMPLELFHRNSLCSYGRANICKLCVKSEKQIYYLLNKARENSRSQGWHIRNPEKKQAYTQQYYQEHRDQILATTQLYHLAEHDHRLAYNQHYRVEHSAVINIKHQTYMVGYREKNGPLLAQKGHDYHQTHKPQAKARKRRHEALQRGAPISDLTAAQWRAIKELYRWCCAYCGKKTVALTQDHMIPLSKGGSHTMENIVPACQSCNSKKGTGAPIRPVQPLLGFDFA